MKSNKMQQYEDIYLLQNHSTCFGCLPHPSSGVHKTVTAASATQEEVCRPDIVTCTRGCNYSYILLVMGAVDARNMQSDFAVNKYLHTVASCWISLTQSYDERNHEYKCYLISFSIQIKRVFRQRSNVTCSTPATSTVVTYAINTPFLTALILSLSLNYRF